MKYKLTITFNSKIGSVPWARDYIITQEQHDQIVKDGPPCDGDFLALKLDHCRRVAIRAENIVMIELNEYLDSGER